MKEITKKVYVSDDGKEFNYREDCLEHEAIANKRKEAFSKFKDIASDIYDACACYVGCEGCSFYNATHSSGYYKDAVTRSCLFNECPTDYFKKIGLVD